MYLWIPSGVPPSRMTATGMMPYGEVYRRIYVANFLFV